MNTTPQLSPCHPPPPRCGRPAQDRLRLGPDAPALDLVEGRGEERRRGAGVALGQLQLGPVDGRAGQVQLHVHLLEAGKRQAEGAARALEFLAGARDPAAQPARSRCDRRRRRRSRR
jgi:hypothetical protein